MVSGPRFELFLCAPIGVFILAMVVDEIAATQALHRCARALVFDGFFSCAFAFTQGFILAMVANEIASRPACDKLTYGPVRAEVLSALFSMVTILVLSMLLVYSAIVRIIGELVGARL